MTGENRNDKGSRVVQHEHGGIRRFAFQVRRNIAHGDAAGADENEQSRLTEKLPHIRAHALMRGKAVRYREFFDGMDFTIFIITGDAQGKRRASLRERKYIGFHRSASRKPVEKSG